MLNLIDILESKIFKEALLELFLLLFLQNTINVNLEYGQQRIKEKAESLVNVNFAKVEICHLKHDL